MGVRVQAIVLVCAAPFLTGMTDAPKSTPNCGQSWAVPGEYYVSGNFRGREESTVIRLSNSCRVHFKVPGVYSGAPVKASGNCVRFSFKYRDEPEPLHARWCGDTGVVPWKGRDIHVKVWQSRRQQNASY